MFDLDGTLIETSPEICDAVNDTLAKIGRHSDTLPGYLKVFDGHYQRRCGTRSHQ